MCKEITEQTLEKLEKRYQTGLFPNIVREYFQHVFLAELYKLPSAEKMLFKGGTALRIVYGSPRFSEDLGFSLVNRSAFRFEDLIKKIKMELTSAGYELTVVYKTEKTVQGIGPIDYSEKGSYNFESVLYSKVVESMKIKQIKIQFFDGTVKVISNPKSLNIDTESED